MIDRDKKFNLAEWYPDVKKIVLKYFSDIPSEDQDDAIQEICMALLKKQGSKGSTYDPKRSAPSHYIIMVAKNVLVNRWNKNKKFQLEQSLEQIVEDTPALITKSETYHDSQNFFLMKSQLNQFETWLVENDPSLVPYFDLLKQGYTYSEICQKRKVNSYTLKQKIQNAIKAFRETIFPFRPLSDNKAMKLWLSGQLRGRARKVPTDIETGILRVKKSIFAST